MNDRRESCVGLTLVVELYSLFLKGGDEGSEEAALGFVTLEVRLGRDTAGVGGGGTLVVVAISASAVVVGSSVVVGSAVVVVGRSGHLAEVGMFSGA
jgi:hypothetical protein